MNYYFTNTLLLAPPPTSISAEIVTGLSVNIHLFKPENGVKGYKINFR